MQLHQIFQTKSKKTKKRVGRGGKRGTYSGRGIKGQKARAGRKLRPEWRDMLKSIPKKRGYRFKSIETKPVILNLADLNKFFKEGEAVNFNTLLQKGLIAKVKGKVPAVKILGKGEVAQKLNLKGLKASQGAKDAIQKAGGTLV